MQKRKNRDPNIELLRIIATMGVIVLHYNNASIGGGFEHVQMGSINAYFLYFLEGVFLCAVNLFVLITGYFMCETEKISVKKPIELLLQVILFNEASYFLKLLLGQNMFSVKGLIGSLLPCNYYVILYCALYMISPYLNIIIGALSEKMMQTFIILIIALFSCWPTCVDLGESMSGQSLIGLSTIAIKGSQSGYTIVNFVLMYFIGAYLRKSNVLWKKQKMIIALFAGCILIAAGMYIGKVYQVNTTMSSYCNPIVILTAVLIFCIFQNIEIGTSKIINGLAKGSFSVYLLHIFFVQHINIKKYVTGNVICMLLHILVSCIAIYLICWLVYFVYNLFIIKIFSLIEKKISFGYISVFKDEKNNKL